MELLGAEFLISITFQGKRYVSIARTGNFIMYACARSLFEETIMNIRRALLMKR